jgi:hypothetical protein
LQHRLHDDRLDGFIEPDFFERKSREWRQTQKRLADQITEYQEAHDYVQDSIRRLELSKRPILYKTARFKRKAKVAQFRVFELNMEGPHSHRDVFASRLIYLQLRTRLGKRKAAGADSSDLRPIWLPTVDNLRCAKQSLVFLIG